MNFVKKVCVLGGLLFCRAEISFVGKAIFL